MGPHILLPPCSMMGASRPIRGLTLDASQPQLSPQSRACRTQGLPAPTRPISTGLCLLNRSSHGQQPLKAQLGSVGRRSISSKKLLTSYLCLKPLSVASAPTSPETAFARVTGTPYHCSSFLGHPTGSSDLICPKLNSAVTPDLLLVFGVSGSGPIRSLDVSLSFLPPALCCPSPPTPRGSTS